VDRGKDYLKKVIPYAIPKKFLNNNFPTKLATIFLLGATLMLLTSPLATNDAFATHLSKELKWQLVFISSETACSNYHLQMTNKYFDVTLQYLDLYNVENSNYDPLCMPLEEYSSDYQSPHDLDLIVLVYDRNLGEKELHSKKMGGLYSHTGIDRSNNHVVIICDCSNFYYSNPVWILSHELSHFILYYKDYEMSVIEDLIHNNDAKYDQCQETYSNLCNSIKTKLSSGYGGHAYTVMPVFSPASKATNENKINNQENNVSGIVLDLSKMITKWWASGKITDGDYANAVGFVVDNNVISSHENTEIIMADDPLDDSQTWEELIKETTPVYWDRPVKTEDDVNKKALSMVPENFLTVNEKQFSDEVILGLPDWFKNTAAWWSQGKITDKEFKKNVEYLVKKGIIRPQTTQVLEALVETEEPVADDKKPAADDKKPAADDKKPAADDKMIQDLIDDVKALKDSGLLKPGKSNSLMKMLNNANTQFNNESPNNGCQTLNQFSLKVTELITDDLLEDKKGRSLLSEALKTKDILC